MTCTSHALFFFLPLKSNIYEKYSNPPPSRDSSSSFSLSSRSTLSSSSSTLEKGTEKLKLRELNNIRRIPFRHSSNLYFPPPLPLYLERTSRGRPEVGGEESESDPAPSSAAAAAARVSFSPGGQEEWGGKTYGTVLFPDLLHYFAFRTLDLRPGDLQLFFEPLQPPRLRCRVAVAAGAGLGQVLGRRRRRPLRRCRSAGGGSRGHGGQSRVVCLENASRKKQKYK